MIARYGDTDYGYSEAGYGYGVSENEEATFYLRPDSSSYLRPDGTSTYERP